MVNIKSIVLILFILFASIAIFSLFSIESDETSVVVLNYVDIINISRAGDFAYVPYNSFSSSKIDVLILNEKPVEKIYILDKSGGLGIDSLADFQSDILDLTSYGLKVEKIDAVHSLENNSLLVIGQGAMPQTVLDILDQDVLVLYVGKTDAVLDRGVNQKDWYSNLDQEKKDKIMLYDSTIDEIYSQNEINLTREILFNSWTLDSNRTFNSQNGSGTLVADIAGEKFIRTIYKSQNGPKIFDSNLLVEPNQNLNFKKVFPNQKQTVDIYLNQTTGIPNLQIHKNSKLIDERRLGVVGQDVFVEDLVFSEPGNYVIKIVDLNNELASGIVQVQDLRVEYVGFEGFQYNFFVTLDGEPISEPVEVRLENSDNSLDSFIFEGQISVPARFQGERNFIFTILNQERSVLVSGESQGGTFDFYISYGPWVITIVVLIYLLVLFTRKQPYKIRFDSVANISSGEVKIKTKTLENLIPKAIGEFGLNKTIMPREFSHALKKYVTNGSDVMDGNSEAILKSLEKKGILQSYKSYYKIKGKESVKKTVIDRLIREKLIEHGSTFKYKKGIFETKDQTIVYGKKIKRKGKLLIVFENDSSISNYLESLEKKEKSKTALQIRNDALYLVKIDDLAEYL